MIGNVLYCYFNENCLAQQRIDNFVQCTPSQIGLKGSRDLKDIKYVN